MAEEEEEESVSWGSWGRSLLNVDMYKKGFSEFVSTIQKDTTEALEQLQIKQENDDDGSTEAVDRRVEAAKLAEEEVEDGWSESSDEEVDKEEEKEKETLAEEEKKPELESEAPESPIPPLVNVESKVEEEHVVVEAVPVGIQPVHEEEEKKKPLERRKAEDEEEWSDWE